MNAHDTLIDAVLTSLRRSPAVCAIVDEDIDLDRLDEGTLEAIGVTLDSSDPGRPALRGAPVTWRSVVVLECYARADGRSDGARPSVGRASRALHARAYERLMADPSLGGVAIDLNEPSIRGDRDQADTRLGCCIAAYPVLHRTQAHSLEQPQ